MSELGVVIHSTKQSCMEDVRRLLRAVKPRPVTAGALRRETGWTAQEISSCLAKLMQAKKVQRFNALTTKAPLSRGYAYIWIGE